MPSNEQRALSPFEALAANYTIITAHSGCEGTAANSREHILAAIASGAEMMEIDVRMEDGHLYLSHDVPASIADCVSLEECFSLIAPHERLMINCDVKTDDLVAPVASLAIGLGLVHRVVFTGQCNHALTQVRALGADMWHSLWMTDHPDQDIDAAREAIRRSGCRALNMDFHMASEAQHTRLTAAGLQMSVWTVDREEDLRAFLRMGVFNITTRRPVLARRLREEIQGAYEAQRLPIEGIERILRSAGEQLLASPEPGGIRAKEGCANYVSQRDMETEEYLIRSLSALVPGATFAGEESQSDPPPDKGVHFVIDPIDGTMNFLHGYRCSAVSVGVLRDGYPVFGIIYNPYADEMFTALRGAGAYLNGRRIHVSARRAGEALVGIGTSSYYKDALEGSVVAMIAEVFRHTADIRRSGSAAAEFCNVACGRTEGFFEMRLLPWDYAAGALIVREAGGIVSDMKGDALAYGAPVSVLCANPVLYPELLAITRRHGDDESPEGGVTV